MKFQYASTYEVEKIIKSLKDKNSIGYDEISNRIIKSSLPRIISPITYICNAILNTGIFPERLKFAIVKPLFKKGKTNNISNYRPISLLTSFSKIIEKLIYTRPISHIEATNLQVKK
jgi:Notch-like protein